MNTRDESSDRDDIDTVVDTVAEVIGENLLDKLAMAAREHNVTISVVISPAELVDTSRDPND